MAFCIARLQTIHRNLNMECICTFKKKKNIFVSIMMKKNIKEAASN